MGTDFSRVRLNPLLDFAGVQLKQGGVLLDADANELVDILDRRFRSMASDTLGRATVSSTTPNAFKIDVSGASLLIGKGRLYVDGLLSENHGATSADPAKKLFDDLLSEPQFADRIAYATQPYLPNPPALPGAGRHLVYLDVWDREVTYLERPDLVESAVGVETTSRVQTVWQVRTLADEAGAGVTCASPDGDISGWQNVIAPSTGVLTTGTFEVAPVDDPCELPPTGGYRGLENQLYRVEIQDPGQPGSGATFKWSRENASVGSRVASMISGGELELATLGRDDVLSFKTGDWVEVIDDVREFSQASGELRKITVVAATRRIQFAPPLPAAMLPGAFPDSTFPDQRNLRVRRWDQSGKVFRTDPGGTPVQIQDLDAAGSTGAITIPAAATTFLLEKGVTVSFASTGAKGFSAGDYWVFAARTSDASVELLDRAPPRGIHHHYARLGIWDVGAGTITDCRHHWPPSGGVAEDCCCTACVTAESHASGTFTIQDGVNKAAQTGGTVCLGPGQYALSEPVQLNGSRSIRIQGQGPATMIATAGGAFAIRNGVALVIEKLAILSLGRQPAISVRSGLGLALRHLAIAVLETNDGRASAISLSGAVVALSISENAILAPSGILANDPSAPSQENDTASLLTAAIAIEDNLLLSSRRGITFEGSVIHLLDTRIAGNDVLTSAETGISMLGRGLAGSGLSISGNTIAVPGSGIGCGVDAASISDNRLNCTANVDQQRLGTQVGILLATGLNRDGLDQCQVLSNEITGFGQAGIELGVTIRDLIIKLNTIVRCGSGILPTEFASSTSLSIENNHLTDIGPANVDTKGFVLGIGIFRADAVTISGNIIRRVGIQAKGAALTAGVLAVATRKSSVSNNQIAEVAPPDGFIGKAAAIMLLLPTADFDVSHNLVDRDATDLEIRDNSDWRALTVLDSDPKTPTAHFATFATVRVDAGNVFVLGAGRPFLAALPAAGIDNQPAGVRGSVIGNTFNARGASPAVDVAAGQNLFNDNRVNARLNEKLAVALATDIAIVNANRVIGGEVSVQVTRATLKSAAVLGNITTGVIVVGGSSLPAPWDALNLRA
jgi:putative cofactor-binding repeat protein